jgi:hypothetical protein
VACATFSYFVGLPSVFSLLCSSAIDVAGMAALVN